MKKIKLDAMDLTARLIDEKNHALITSVDEGVSEVVCGFNSYFADDLEAVCSSCGRVVSIRPWLKKIVETHGLPVVCVKCAT